MFKKILVTGGAGFIASHFLEYMTRKYLDYEFVVLDLLKYTGIPENLTDLVHKTNCVLLQGSTVDPEAVEKAVHGVDGIINFAAQSHVDRSIYDPGIFVKANLLGTEILLEKARGLGIQKFVQISTAEVYGSLGTGGFFLENSPLNPSNPYGATKAGADLLVSAYYKTYGLPVNISRCTNNYGPRQFPEKLIPLLITNALEDKELPIFGTGDNIHDWLYVEDHCRAIDLILHYGKSGEIYNIGGHNEFTNLEITRIILRELQKPEELIRFVKDRPCHDLRLAVDATKIERELGWVSQYNFSEGIKKTIDWYVENVDWWKKIKAGPYQEYYRKIYQNR